MNIDEIIKRIKISCGYASEAALARALKMSPQNFNSQKKTGKIKDSLMIHAVEKGVNIHWIKTGQGSMLAGQPSAIAEPPTNYGASTPPAESLLDLTADVLASDSIFRTALESNVRAFHEAVSMRKEIAVLKCGAENAKKWASKKH